MLCVPIQEMVTSDFHMAFLNLMSYSSFYMPGCIEGYIHGKGSDAAGARNHCIDQAQTAEFDYYCFIDSDMGFPKSALQTLLDTAKKGKNVVSAVSFQKFEPFFPTIYKDNEFKQPESYRGFPLWEEFEVDSTGAAFLLVKRDIVQDLRKKYFARPFEWTHLSEDLTFCKRIKELGEEIWVNSNVLTGHYTMVARGLEDFVKGKECKKEESTEEKIKKPDRKKNIPIKDSRGKIFDPDKFLRTKLPVLNNINCPLTDKDAQLLEVR